MSPCFMLILTLRFLFRSNFFAPYAKTCYCAPSNLKDGVEVWNSRTHKLVGGPVSLPYELKSLLPVRDTRFAIIYGIDDDKVEIWECESGDKVLAFESNPFFSTEVISANGEHIIHVSEQSANTLELTGAIVNSITLSPYLSTSVRRSLNGKYVAWVDDGKIKLFDVDTETLLTGSSLDQPVTDVWLSDYSKRVIIISKENRWEGVEFLDVWDIQSKNMVAETIRCPFPDGGWVEIFSKKHLIVFNRRLGVCFICDLDAYEIMSPLYKTPPLLAAGGYDIKGAPVSKGTETLEYALMAWEKASIRSFAKTDYDGWIRGLQNELLFWVPEKMRERLCLPCTTYMSYRKVTKLNFTNFVHGANWTECGPRDDLGSKRNV